MAHRFGNIFPPNSWEPKLSLFFLFALYRLYCFLWWGRYLEDYSFKCGSPPSCSALLEPLIPHREELHLEIGYFVQ